MIKFLDLKKQYDSISAEIDTAIYDTINNSSYIGGASVSKFEEEFGDFAQVPYCIGVANGTDAIEIALKSLGLKPGSEIIVPANSFISTSEAVTNSGYRVIFCDICPETCNISINNLKKKINDNTGAVILVHLYGMPAPIEEIMELCAKRSIKVIEDCAQAHGATSNGRHVGSFGDLGTFSFYPGKNLGAYGDAGAIVTTNGNLAERCRRISNHGRSKKYDHDFEGRNSRLDALQASILSTKLRHLNSWIEKRREIAQIYRSLLPESLLLQKVPSNVQHAYHLFVIRIKNRDRLKAFLEENNVQTGIHYPIALPDLNAYKYMDQNGQFINASSNAKSILSLPMGEHLELKQVEKVVELINCFCDS
ncbi:DegT/DnrJ/EryC1/StrS family aminotransferase [Pseudopelagicola sp. nBUS_20]|uniref:DegT/DnrJ/EryC1/StrS family aminotransferase n=1 Tax=Pseudopelagicola sp. nBUS_20 TaxID=3395317 RepID=UPI003EB787B7